VGVDGVSQADGHQPLGLPGGVAPPCQDDDQQSHAADIGTKCVSLRVSEGLSAEKRRDRVLVLPKTGLPWVLETTQACHVEAGLPSPAPKGSVANPMRWNTAAGFLV
jgi:hypothetical protein